MRKTTSNHRDRAQPTAPPVILLPLRRAAPSPAGQSRTSAANLRRESAAGPALEVGSAASSRPAELAHDARNLLSALSLYCELLAGPGVLAPQFRHYAEDLRRVGQTGVRLIEALAGSGPESRPKAEPPAGLATPFHRHPFPGIRDLAAELRALEAPLRALAGPDIHLEVDCADCGGALALNAEDLLRILFNLVANTVEAMRAQPAANRRPYLRITAQRGQGASFLPRPPARPEDTVVLSVRDNGPGIAAENIPYIFDPGFSTRCAWSGHPGLSPRIRQPAAGSGGPDFSGLGLAIVRQLAEAAGGAVRVVSSPGVGARFDIELPVAGGANPPAEASGGGLKRGSQAAKNLPPRLAADG